MKITEYISKEKHLPKFLKDFHDQKDFFKSLWWWQQKGGESTELSKHTWVSQHIYTIDIFLKFMAFHGYKLKKIRSVTDTHDINETISIREKEVTNILEDALSESIIKLKEPETRSDINERIQGR